MKVNVWLQGFENIFFINWYPLTLISLNMELNTHDLLNSFESCLF